MEWHEERVVNNIGQHILPQPHPSLMVSHSSPFSTQDGAVPLEVAEPGSQASKLLTLSTPLPPSHTLTPTSLSPVLPIPPPSSLQDGAIPIEVAEPGSQAGELLILSTAARQLFDGSGAMSTDAVVSLLSALVDVSSRTLHGPGITGAPGGLGAPGAGGAGGGAGGAGAAPRGQASLLHRMTDVLLSNLGRLQVRDDSAPHHHVSISLLPRPDRCNLSHSKA